MRTLPLVMIAAALAGAAIAAPVPPAARAEIDALLDRLQASGCTFNRNGTWYQSADAKAHLARKLQGMEEKGLVQTAEQFIERGASSSSVSNKPYLVKCGGTAPVESRTWLGNELKALRAGKP